MYKFPYSKKNLKGRIGVSTKRKGGNYVGKCLSEREKWGVVFGVS